MNQFSSTSLSNEWTGVGGTLADPSGHTKVMLLQPPCPLPLRVYCSPKLLSSIIQMPRAACRGCTPELQGLVL